ncbi:hypothetical protein AAFF_G00230110 [Aldrovandia affinis]|uniref:Fibronectin type III domain containing 3B n=1 Tax=Aldrovandia affinis TaxID=143900 RepID=A0AAD7SVT6_9TELE|nr:hypothetical protein AAFF_G00230110 [Aldrovandia affinis]
MYVTMMMTDQMPLDLPPPLLNGEVPMMPHMVNGDGSQQVILVQVNPGETFTIRAEDGSLQCIQGASKHAPAPAGLLCAFSRHRGGWGADVPCAVCQRDQAMESTLSPRPRH